MAQTPKGKAEERFAGLQKRDQAVKHDLDIASRLRSEKTAKLRQLRLAKEAEEAAIKETKSVKKPVIKKQRVRSALVQA